MILARGNGSISINANPKLLETSTGVDLELCGRDFIFGFVVGAHVHWGLIFFLLLFQDIRHCGLDLVAFDFGLVAEPTHGVGSAAGHQFGEGSEHYDYKHRIWCLINLRRIFGFEEQNIIQMLCNKPSKEVFIFKKD